MIRVNRLAYPVTTLGFGKRIALWVQGCGRKCPGCSAHDTWDYDGGESVEELLLAHDVAGIAVVEDAVGVTITGGEPFDQADAVASFVALLRATLEERDPRRGKEFDVLIYTGMGADEAAARSRCLWAAGDAFVCGPYRENEPSANPLFGSGNQELVCVTTRGRRHLDFGAVGSRHVIQYSLGAGDLSFAGITRAGDLGRMERELGSRGIRFGVVSWQG